MEAKQFYNQSISPLVTRSFACKWSEDNRLSIVTEKGVQIIEIVPSATQASPILHLARSFFNAPEAMPCAQYEKYVLSNIFQWPKEEIYSYLLQDALTPTFPKALPATSDIVDVFWSPYRLLHPLECLLAAVTTTGAIQLVAQIDRTWISIYEFNAVLAENIEEDIQQLKRNKKIDSQALKEQLYRLLVTTATWSCLYQSPDKKCFAYLVTAQRSSEIAVWKVDQLSKESIDLEANITGVQLKFIKKVNSESIKINILLWVNLSDKSYLLFIGYFNGHIGVLKLEQLEEGLTASSCETCYSEDDGIPVDYLNLLQQTDDTLEILVIRGIYLIILVVDITGKFISMKFVASPGFSITGVSIVNSDMILIATQDGNLYVINKSQNQEELICTPIKLDVTKSFVQYLGLASSPNKVISTFITSPNTVFDHLISREPSTLCFFNIIDLPLFDPLDTLYRNKEESLLNYWDCLELIKVNAIKSNNPMEIIPRLTANLEFLSVYRMRIAYWIMTMAETLRKKNVFDVNLKLAEEIEQCKTYIFLHSAANHLSRLAKRENLNNVQKLCMSLLRNHLDIWLAGEEEEADTPLSEHVKEVLEATSQLYPTEQEKCNFCDVVITEPWALSCSKGHKLPRCALTCLQVTCTKYRTCLVCNEIFHPCLDEEFNEVRCLYCDLPATYKNRLLDSFLQTSKKNLSRKKPLATSNKDSKEEDI
ncbi:hypothetical protein TSAR_016781 [Trichomalopsis sarcophagae]|uniref:Transcription factor IIIC 90kDa subunit N-terminal domain-containing protein n=1 Tax=Trichomalopsis sarcophagae TaxID=543379 RepID=A0A232F6W8_9HYME|nr:hypothetical protein TSAR_016781 [Trichomalopsis sarcophagae]